MTGTRSTLALAWSGGKDCAMALHKLRSELGVEPCLLLSTVGEDDGRIAHHGICAQLLHRQAQAAGVALLEVPIPNRCSNEIYAQRMSAALASQEMAHVRRIAFGDLLLEDLRDWREAQLAQTGREGVFPLWASDTDALAREIIEAGFRAVVCAVDSARLDRSLVGSEYDERFLRCLPAGVDPCGENGEFHTFVYDGPIFCSPIALADQGRERCDGLERCLLACA